MIYRGDDTRAFGGKPIKVKLLNADNKTITKAEFRCGDILQAFENPTFPLQIYLSSEETAKLRPSNICYLAVYDESGYKKLAKVNLNLTVFRRLYNGRN